MRGVRADHGIAAGAVTASYRRALHGFAATLPPHVATRLAEDPRVRRVSPDRWVTTAATQTSPPSWGLDRIDERTLPLSGDYTYGTTGAGVKAYIVDTGVRGTHVDFGDRVAAGWYADRWFTSTDDCSGHGTHVAGTVGGQQVGVAKGVTIVPVKALGLTADDEPCGDGGWDADIIAGIDWIIQDHHAGQPAVANLSLGGPAAGAEPLETAIRAAVADGVTFVVAAGNEDQDACNVSPARVPEVLTVGATGENDKRAGFSNYGSCLDVFAPGVHIISTSISDDIDAASMSGTSMAAPHVAGAAARYLEATPGASPDDVAAAITRSATPAAVSAAGYCSPTDLLYADDAWPSADTPPSRLTISAPSSITYGDSARIAGRLTSDGDPVGCEDVRVQKRRAGTRTWTAVRTLQTDARGRISHVAKPPASTYFRLRYAGGAYAAAKSGNSLVGVATRVSGNLSDSTVNRNSRVTLSGKVSPLHAGRTVTLQRYRDGRWRSVKSDALNAKSRYSFRLGTSTRGRYRYRVVMPAHTDHLRGCSPIRILTVG